MRLRARLMKSFIKVAAALSLLAVLLRPGGGALVEAADPMFGNGSDGAISFSSNTQFNPPVDAVVASGAGSTLTLSSPSGAFVAGQRILIHQTRGSAAGAWELNSVQSYALGTLTTSAPLAHTYASSGADAAQVLVVPQYTSVTVNVGVTLNAKPWNGATGGILAFEANGTVTLAGNIVADGASGPTSSTPTSGGGFRGGAGGTVGEGVTANQGEGTGGAGTTANAANGNGGGASTKGHLSPTSAGGAGGGNGTAGTSSGSSGSSTGGAGGGTAGSTDLTNVVFGGAGGGAGGNSNGFAGANGGGIVFISAATFTVSGTITSNGGTAAGRNAADDGVGGGGAGSSILIKVQTATLGSSLISAVRGIGGVNSWSGTPASGNGGDGRIRVEYCTSISGGFATPSPSVAQISCSVGPPPSVGGIAEQPDVTGLQARHSMSSPNHQWYVLGAEAVSLVAAVAVASGWLLRRRHRVR